DEERLGVHGVGQPADEARVGLE
ncbi:unnamed protein product, partial [Fusarium fujikuroi]